MSRVSSTVTKRKANPRPRKYASASERQAAYRARAPEVCFRAESKTVETLDRIAETLDQSRADVLLSMTKFALANHDWARFGLTHKPLPFEYGVNPVKPKLKAYEGSYAVVSIATGQAVAELPKDSKLLDKINTDKYRLVPIGEYLSGLNRKTNPMKTTRAKRKPTSAQLAARERFAEMARSGAFAKGRKRNPAGSRYEIRTLDKRNSVDSTYQTLTHAKNALDEIDRPPASFYVVDTETGKHYFSFQAQTKLPNIDIRGTAMQREYQAKRKTNPAKKTVSQKISQLTREGYPQKQAVAIALNEERAGKVRRNPAAKKNGPFYFALVPDDGGFAYGMDERTPVQFIFTNRDRTRGIYRSFALPFSVTGNPAFQAWAASLPGNAVFASLKELRETLRAYT